MPITPTSLLVTSRDQVLTVDTRFADGGNPWPVLRLVPEPYVPIISVTLVSATAGYALTGNALHAVEAPTDLPWRSSQVPVPEGDWIEVWADGARGRLGYRDGQVYALPSRVPIAPTLPGAQQVTDYSTLCDVPFALAPDGLYRLTPNPDAGAVGVWQAENLDGVISPALADRGFAGGKLWQDGQTLYLVSRFGTVVRLTPAGGCP
jgi:hypothetical protein